MTDPIPVSEREREEQFQPGAIVEIKQLDETATVGLAADTTGMIVVVRSDGRYWCCGAEHLTLVTPAPDGSLSPVPGPQGLSKEVTTLLVKAADHIHTSCVDDAEAASLNRGAALAAIFQALDRLASAPPSTPAVPPAVEALQQIAAWDNHTHDDAEGQAVCPTCHARSVLERLVPLSDVPDLPGEEAGRQVHETSQPGWPYVVCGDCGVDAHSSDRHAEDCPHRAVAVDEEGQCPYRDRRDGRYRCVYDAGHDGPHCCVRVAVDETDRGKK